MTTISEQPREISPKPKRRVRVTRAQVAAAQAQIHISRQLGVPVPEVIERIARAG